MDYFLLNLFFFIKNQSCKFKIRFLVIFLIIIFPSAFKAQEKQNVILNGINKFYHENGKISSEGNMSNGKPNGYWKTYSENGNLKSEGNRKNFELDSLWKFYNNDGKIVLEFNYKAGKKNGLKKTYDSKENYLIYEENYKDDIKQGLTKYYYKEGGKIYKTVNFEKGKEEGISFEYTLDSMIITVTEYKIGFIKRLEKINRRDKNGQKQGVWKDFYFNGNLQKEGTYRDDKKNGFFKEYTINGSLLNTDKFINGELQKDVPELTKLDMKTEYYEGGNIKYFGGYKNEIAQGVHREYDITGKVTNSKIYKDGILTGEGILDDEGREQGSWKEYHPNGQIKSKGEYLNGKKIEDWIFYYANGKIEQKGKYDKKGKAQGTWIWYFENEKVLREENYIDNLQEGSMVEYNDTGGVVTKGEYAEGQKEGEWIYEMGDYREIGKYKSDKLEGYWKHFYHNGILRFEGNFIDGNPDGKHKFYYPDGKIKEIGKYSVGRKEEDWEYFNEDGTLFLTITYKGDIEVKFDGVKVKPILESEN